jgi:hypothetical protein
MRKSLEKLLIKFATEIDIAKEGERIEGIM